MLPFGILRNSQMATSTYYPGVRTLGLRSKNALAAAEAVQQGLSPDTPLRLANVLGVSLSVVGHAVRLAPRTLARRKAQQERLSVDESERVLRVAALYEQAVAVLGSPEAAQRWLVAPLPVFEGRSPLSLVGTEIGAREVERLLGRLEHGVFS